ncbi:MAG: ABC-type multidrug transport system ATPase subunit/pSer/pThr [Planctomycetota bacterium]|jgi:ABC-type multidrug transport system ATPase subunit/pSer/pThr/pTyr-binding forkhead associated (FHA) protein
MTPYPLLTSDALDEPVPLPRGGKAFLVGRGSSADLIFEERSCSREQFTIRERSGEFVLEVLSTTVPTRVDGNEVSGEVGLEHGSSIGFANIELEFHAFPDSSKLTLPSDREPESDLGDTLGPDDEGGQRQPELSGPMEIDVRAGIIGRGADVAHLLDHPQISRHHARLRIANGQTSIRDLESANGTFVNGARIDWAADLQVGDRVDIGPYSLVFQGDAFIRSSRKGNARIVATGLGHSVLEHGGGTKSILREVTLVVEPQEMLAIIGPTGSGKSTLMRALSARVPAQDGQVSINGVDLYTNFESLKRGMAFVSQHEVLHEELTVEEAVRFTARLRLPIDTPVGVLESAVREAISRVDLQRQASTLVRDLSGGQHKRASVACEIASQPDLLFVDEVTSGLDDQADWEMMRLLRRSADRGMTVVCIAHNLANVLPFCHKIAVMTRPGHLAFCGTGQDALAYFETTRLADIYGKLARHEGAHWHKQYRCSDAWRESVASKLTKPEPTRAAAPVDGKRRWMHWWRDTLHQFRVLIERYTMSLLRDRRVLGLAVLQSLLVGGAISLAFVGAEGVYRELARFLLAVSCLWFGCNSASKEIVKERRTYRQERDVNLHISSYLASKFVGLGAIGILQVLALFLVSAFGPAALGFGHVTLMMASLWVGCGLGLAISATMRTPDQATWAVPIVLIPQIVLSGALMSPLHTVPDWIGRLFVTGYWIEGVTQELATQSSRAAGYWMLALHFTIYMLAAGFALRSYDSSAGGGPRDWVVWPAFRRKSLS